MATAEEALRLILSKLTPRQMLDIGCGNGYHAQEFSQAGWHVTLNNLYPPADYVGDFMDVEFGVHSFGLVWASHVLEHQPNVGAFLRKCGRLLTRDGILAITVPPMKNKVVGGHIAQFNAGTLLYNLVLAGFDCREAKVKTYGYNISVIVWYKPITLPKLKMDKGDLELLAPYLPPGFKHGTDGRITELNWSFP